MAQVSLGSALGFALAALALLARLGGGFLPGPSGFGLGVGSAFGCADFGELTALSRRSSVH